jgi:hypothetical protein
LYADVARIGEQVLLVARFRPIGWTGVLTAERSCVPGETPREQRFASSALSHRGGRMVDGVEK